ncbi:MAG: nucleotide exchange factor GrpE [Halothece sp.]
MLALTHEERDRLKQEISNLYKERVSLQQAIREQQEQHQAANEQLFLELLELFDTLEFLLNYLEENPDPNPQFYKRLPKSVGSIQKKLLTILKRRQVNRIEFEGEQPDFSCCQVVDCEIRDDLEEHTITKTVRQGFRLEEKLLRPIEVITAKKS